MTKDFKSTKPNKGGDSMVGQLVELAHPAAVHQVSIHGQIVGLQVPYLTEVASHSIRDRLGSGRWGGEVVSTRAGMYRLSAQCQLERIQYSRQ